MKKTVLSASRAAFMCAITMGVALTTAAGDANAYVAKHTTGGLPVRWAQSSVHFAIDPAFDDAVPGGVAAVQRAVESWSEVAGAPTITTSVGVGDAKPGNDGKNCIFYAKSGYAPAAAALAVTVLSFDEDSGNIVDADIVVNGAYAFADLPADAHHDPAATPLAMEAESSASGGAGDVFDLTHVVAHEGGHSVGLGDEPNDASALMFPYTYAGDASLRAPASDDEAGVTTLYAGHGDDTTDSSSAAGCGATVAPRGLGRRGQGLAAAAVTAFALSLASARRRRMRIAKPGVARP